MKILVLNGSPRPNGNTAAMVEAFAEGAKELSSGSNQVYDGAIYEYQNSFLDYLQLENMGIFTAYDKQNKSEEKLAELKAFGKSLV